MATTLIDNVRSAFTADVISKIATLLGEPKTNIQKAIHGAIPLVIIDIIHKSYFPERVTPIDGLARNAATSDFFGEMHELNTASGTLMAGSLLLNKGTEFARGLLGTRLDPVVSEISRYATISIPSASFVVGIVSFAALDSIGRHLNNYSADAGGLPLWIKTHTDSTRSSIPADLKIKEALGIDEYYWERKEYRAASRPRSGSSAFVAVLIIVIVAVAFILLYQRYHNNSDVTANPAADTTHVSNRAPSADTANSARR
jgi:hypothetical protein